LVLSTEVVERGAVDADSCTEAGEARAVVGGADLSLELEAFWADAVGLEVAEGGADGIEAEVAAAAVPTTPPVAVEAGSCADVGEAGAAVKGAELLLELEASRAGAVGLKPAEGVADGIEAEFAAATVPTTLFAAVEADSCSEAGEVGAAVKGAELLLELEASRAGAVGLKPAERVADAIEAEVSAAVVPTTLFAAVEADSCSEAGEAGALVNGLNSRRLLEVEVIRLEIAEGVADGTEVEVAAAVSAPMGAARARSEPLLGTVLLVVHILRRCTNAGTETVIMKSSTRWSLVIRSSM
jgi:hypothetical protein